MRPRTEFVIFRNQDVGRRGGIERVAGRRANGSWDTQKWLIGKSEAHRAGKQLAPDTAAARKVLKQLGSTPRHLGGDRFIARPRRNDPGERKADAGDAARAACQYQEGAGRLAQAAGARMIRKLGARKYRLYSRKVNPRSGRRRNLGTFSSRKAAEQHERAVQYFKRH